MAVAYDLQFPDLTPRFNVGASLLPRIELSGRG